MNNNVERIVAKSGRFGAYQRILLWISNTWIFYACKFSFSFFLFLLLTKKKSESINRHQFNFKFLKHSTLWRIFETSFFSPLHTTVCSRLFLEHEHKKYERKPPNCWKLKTNRKRDTERKKYRKNVWKSSNS